MEVVRAQPEASHGPWLSPAAHAKGLALTEDGAARPLIKRKSVSRSRLADDAQGMEAGWPRLNCQAWFTRARPRMRCAYFLCSPIRTKFCASLDQFECFGIQLLADIRPDKRRTVSPVNQAPLGVG